MIFHATFSDPGGGGGGLPVAIRTNDEQKPKINSSGSPSPLAVKKFGVTGRKAITVTTENQLIAHQGGKSAEINITRRERCRWGWRRVG